jgi:hypothetical protein
VLLAKLAGAMKGNLTKAAGLFQAPLSQVARWPPRCRRRKSPRPAAPRRRHRLRRHRCCRPPLLPTPPRHRCRRGRRGQHRLTPEGEIMAKLSTTELLDAFKEMTLLELSDFVKQFEETFEVTAAAPVAVAAAAAAGGGDGGAPAAEEQDEFDVILEAPATRRSRSSRRCAA